MTADGNVHVAGQRWECSERASVNNVMDGGRRDVVFLPFIREKARSPPNVAFNFSDS